MQLTPSELPPVSALLRAGGILYDIEGDAKQDVLRELVARLPLPSEKNRDVLLSELEARERRGSTGIGGGIAIPHLREHAIIRADQPLLSLGLLRRPVDFNAIDRAPVHAIFMVLSPTVTTHIRILGQLGRVLRDPMLVDLLRRSAPAVDILHRIETVERTHHSSRK